MMFTVDTWGHGPQSPESEHGSHEPGSGSVEVMSQGKRLVQSQTRVPVIVFAH